ncbi:MAG: hypothetical protein QM496_05970 [Verrucomicrobiota bacterium]
MTKLPKSWSKRFACLGCIGALSMSGVVLAFGIFLIGWTYTPNWVANVNPFKEEAMVDAAWEWGQFAPLPVSARNFRIETSGSPFTRTFSGSFSADQEILKNWIIESPGIKFEEGKKLDSGRVKYSIIPGGGASFGSIELDKSVGILYFTISWS